MPIEALRDIQRASASAFASGGSPSYTTGTATITFGTDRSMGRVTVASAGVGASTVIALLFNEAGTTDHSADEHLIENYDLKVANIVPGTGFDIVMLPRDKFGLRGSWSFKWSY